jgi:multiple sugar transport system permease protein
MKMKKLLNDNRLQMERVFMPAVFIGPGILLLGVFILYPILFSFGISFKDFTLANMSNSPWNGLENYRFVMGDPVFWTSVRTTLIFSLFTVFFSFIFAFGFAMLLAAIRGRQFFASLILTPITVAPVVVGLLFKIMFSKSYGIVDYIFGVLHIQAPNWLADPHVAIWTVISVGIWMAIPLNAIILLAALQGVPEELYESAALDGANFWQRLTYITLPYIKPVSGAVILMSTINAIKEFDVVYSLTSGGPGSSTLTVTYYANNVGFEVFQLGRAAAASNIIFIIIIIATILLSLTLFRRGDSNA